MQISRVELLLNSVSDVCANQGALRGKLEPEEVASVRAADELQGKILRRLVAIQREIFLTCKRERGTDSRVGLAAARKRAGIASLEARRL
eukprot:4041310-Pyramimonas_sp.AAC.1